MEIYHFQGESPRKTVEVVSSEEEQSMMFRLGTSKIIVSYRFLIPLFFQTAVRPILGRASQGIEDPKGSNFLEGP